MTKKELMQELEEEKARSYNLNLYLNWLINHNLVLNLGKCIVYGLSGCEATDWSGKADACGFINKVHHGMSVIDMYKHAPKPKKENDDGVIDGQISLFDEEEEHET